MRRFYFLIIVCLGLVSCKNEIDTLIMVDLNPEFLTLNEGNDEPMKMKSVTAEVADTAIYAVQIYENETAVYYGLFNDVSKMQIALSTSKSYKFKVAAYKKGTGAGLKTMADTAGVNYFLPNKIPLQNKFIKGDLLKDIDSAGSIILIGQAKDYNEVDAFYSTKTVSIDKNATTIDFSMLRMGFGINFTIDGLTTGKLEIYLGNDTIKLNSSKTSAFTVRQFSSVKNNFETIFTNEKSFADSIAINAKWTSETGTVVAAAGKYNFTRNYQKNINIQLNALKNQFTFEGWGETVTDIDGNVYHTVVIGDQTWMVENLKVTKLNDGVVIPQVLTASAWSTLTTPGLCYYNNDENSYKNVYGALYNWYAVNTGKLAPQGWHVATDADWTTLTTYLGGVDIAGGKMKEAGLTHWTPSNYGATNESGFTALPAGNRGSNNGTFDRIGDGTFWWTSTAQTDVYSYFRSIGYSSAGVGKSGSQKMNGLSVRCVKNQ